MSKISIQQIANYINYKGTLKDPTVLVDRLLIDSRKLLFPKSTLFFALKGKRDGHIFIEQLYKEGVRNFVVNEIPTTFPDANFIKVDNTLQALQLLAKKHRASFAIPIIGITGSNGKTVIKEWLYQLLSPEFNIARSPKSYNSQLGVPLSVWNLSKENNLGIFEAGISTINEMEILGEIIQPTLGILTNIGSAHDEGFKNVQEKIKEKLKLFNENTFVIYSPDYLPNNPITKGFSWSVSNPKADLFLKLINKKEDSTNLFYVYLNQEFEIKLPFQDIASIENASICIACLLHLKYPIKEIQKRISTLIPIGMRMELKNGINNCSLLNDSYSADLKSLEIALDLLNQQNQQRKKTLILSDIPQSKMESKELYEKVNALITQFGIAKLIGIGNEISKFSDLFKMEKYFFDSTKAFIDYHSINFRDESILIKGARSFEFEKIEKRLEAKNHETILEINLNSLIHNYNFFRSKLNPKTKIMAMVKAFGYGSGSYEIANVLQFMKADYLAVAYADEGAQLRNNGISLPIMVMSPEQSGFETMVQKELEPEIYGKEILNQYIQYLSENHSHNLSENSYPIHLKVETGMNRLGFEFEEIEELIETLHRHKFLKIKSIFSHLAASEDARQDNFTGGQFDLYKKFITKFEKAGFNNFIQHISNSGAALRHPNYALDMVRIGIGLYGVDPSGGEEKLEPLGKLKTTVSQIKYVKKGNSIGYNRMGIANEDLKIAIVKIGYADGYSRQLGNGKAYMLVNGQKAYTIGNICMDMCMLDVSKMDCMVDDEVIVMGRNPSLQQISEWTESIPYEILTNLSQRIKRVYFYD